MNGSDLIFNGEIVLEGTVLEDEWCQWMNGGCFSSKMVREALAEFDGDVTVKVNSGGGDPFEGEAVRASLQEHKGNVRVVVVGLAASAASLMIMSADVIEMSAGAVMMIHDPSGCMCGTADELRKEGARLDVLADVYAGVYAARSGQTTEELRQIMKDELWVGPQGAIDAGFADAVLGEDPAPVADPDGAVMTAARATFQNAQASVLMCADKMKLAASDPDAVQPTGTAGQQQAAQAATQRSMQMPPETPPAVIAPANPAPVAALNQPTEMSAEDAVQGERTRVRMIRDVALPFIVSGQLTQMQVDAVIDEGTPAAEAGNRLMATMTAAEPLRTTPAEPRGARRDETDTKIEGMTSALMRNYDGPGADYRGITLKRLAMDLAGPTRGYNDRESVRQGIMSTTMMGGAHGVSDFSYITGEVMNRRLLDEYERREPNWSAVTGAAMSAMDFRELHAVRFGGDFQLKPVSENGEYRHAVLQDQAEGLKVERRGRTVKLSFEAIVNDDMGALDRIPREFVIGARVMEAGMVWGIVRNNAALKSDNVALFSAAHGNLAAAGGAISVTSVAAGRKAIWEQRAFGTKDGDDFLSIEPDQLIVPPALEVTALQFVGATVPTKDSDENPYKSTLKAVVAGNLGASAGGSDTSWYLVSSDMPPVAHAYLEGYEAPTIQIVEGMNPRGVTMDIDHIFGAAPQEYRGAYKNAG